MKLSRDITPEQQALEKLESFLISRIEKTKNDKLSDKTVCEIFNEVSKEKNK